MYYISPKHMGFSCIHKYSREEAMLFETDTTTTQVVTLYICFFAFFFGLAFLLLKKNS